MGFVFGVNPVAPGFDDAVSTSICKVIVLAYLLELYSDVVCKLP